MIKRIRKFFTLKRNIYIISLILVCIVAVVLVICFTSNKDDNKTIAATSLKTQTPTEKPQPKPTQRATTSPTPTEQIIESHEESTIILDINPSIQIVVDADNVISSIEGLNEDGEDLIMQLKLPDDEQGQYLIDQLSETDIDIAVALELILEECIRQGYLEQDNFLLVSLDAYSEENYQNLSKVVANTLEPQIDSFVVLIQETVLDPEVYNIADQYQVSIGKASYIYRAMEKSTDLPIEILLKLPTDSISYLYGEAAAGTSNNILSLDEIENISYEMNCSSGDDTSKNEDTVLLEVLDVMNFEMWSIQAIDEVMNQYDISVGDIYSIVVKKYMVDDREQYFISFRTQEKKYNVKSDVKTENLISCSEKAITISSEIVYDVPEDENSVEWSEWSEWMDLQEMSQLIENQYSNLIIDTERKSQYRNIINDVYNYSYRYREITYIFGNEVSIPEGISCHELNRRFPYPAYWVSWELHPDEYYTAISYSVGQVKYLSDWSDWLPYGEDNYPGHTAGFDYLVETRSEGSEYSPWRDTASGDGFDGFHEGRTLARFRWKKE